PLIVSVAGESVGDYVTLVKALGPAADLVEFNISSPNTRLVYEWSRKPRELVALLRAVRAATDKPLVVKRSPDFADANEAEIIPCALAAGVAKYDDPLVHGERRPKDSPIPRGPEPRAGRARAFLADKRSLDTEIATLVRLASDDRRSSSGSSVTPTGAA